MARGKAKAKLRAKLFAAQGGLCFWCGRAMVLEYERRGKQLRKNFCTLDHVFPRGDPRRHDAELARQITTKVAACFRCNHSRGDTPFEEFKARMEEANGPLA